MKIGKKIVKISELIEYSKTFENKRFKQIIKEGEKYQNTDKGKYGLFVEKNIFGIEQNNENKPDLEHLNIDIKTTPFKKLIKNGEYRFKERLKITSLNYEQEYLANSFEESSVYKKILKIILFVYLHENNISFLDTLIVKTKYLDFTNEKLQDDLRQMKCDWELINKKIKSGEAKTISSSDTQYLEACTSGSGKEKKKNRYTKETDLRARSWAIKQSYLNTLINSKELEKVVKNKDEVFIDKLEKVLNSISGKFIKDLLNNKLLLDYDKQIQNTNKPKNIYKSFVLKIICSKLGVKNIKNIEEFHKANLNVKVLIVNQKGNFQEHISFPTIKFSEEFAENKKWSETNLFEILKQKFIIIKVKKVQEEYKIDSWNYKVFTDLEGDNLEEVWLEERRRYQSNELEVYKVKQKNGFIQKNNFLKQSSDKIVHIRAHARYGLYNDKFKEEFADYLKNGKKFTKTSWWINKKEFLKNKK